MTSLPPEPRRRLAAQNGASRSGDDALLAELGAPGTVEQARESLEYWQQRQAALPLHRRAERVEARTMVARWQQRLAAAQRATNGPGLLEQVLDALGVTWRPHPRRVMAALGLLTATAMVILIAIVVAVIVFWPQLEPIVRLFTGNENGE